MDLTDKALLAYFAETYPHFLLTRHDSGLYSLSRDGIALKLDDALQFERRTLQRVMILIDSCQEDDSLRIYEFKIASAVNAKLTYMVYGKGFNVNAAFQDAGLSRGHLEGMEYYLQRMDLFSKDWEPSTD